MAVNTYTVAHALFANAGVDWDAATIRALLVKSGATYDATDATVTDVIAGSVEVTVSGYARQTLTCSAPTAASPSVCDATDTVFSALVSGETIVAVVVYKFVTNDAGSTPLFWMDGGATTWPTNGGDFTVAWNASGVFTI